MNIAQVAQTRYTTKAFDPTKKISAELVAQIETLLRHAPSSVNSQLWYFVIAASDEGKARIARATQPAYTYNEPKIKNASHVVVFCVCKDFGDDHMATILAQEDKDGRFATPKAKASQNTSRGFHVNLHRNNYRDVHEWMTRQVYLALGTLLVGAATLEIDACPMEGIDTAILDRELGLADKSYASVVACLGYRASTDANARAPKSRLPAETVISHT